MSIQRSGEMYLETILILSLREKKVRSVDVGEYMGFSKPSVSRAMGILKAGGYVATDEDGYIHLTQLGSSVAEKTYERHRILTEFFVSLGVERSIAAEDACRIEHDISDTSFDALKKFAEKL